MITHGKGPKFVLVCPLGSRGAPDRGEAPPWPDAPAELTAFAPPARLRLLRIGARAPPLAPVTAAHSLAWILALLYILY